MTQASGRDPLQALGELGLSRAVETLERLTDETWLAETLALDGAGGRLHGFDGEPQLCAILLSWKGGCGLVTLAEQEAQEVARAYLFNTVEPGEDFLDRREELMERLGGPALAEFANVIVHAPINAWANACGKGFLLSPPLLLRGPANEVEERAARGLSERVPRVARVISMRFTSGRLAARLEVRFFLSAEAAALLSTGAPA